VAESFVVSARERIGRERAGVFFCRAAVAGFGVFVFKVDFFISLKLRKTMS
jgi:hypothetical protein